MKVGVDNETYNKFVYRGEFLSQLDDLVIFLIEEDYTNEYFRNRITDLFSSYSITPVNGGTMEMTKSEYLKALKYNLYISQLQNITENTDEYCDDSFFVCVSIICKRFRDLNR